MDKVTTQELNRALIHKIGPVDMDLVIGAVAQGGKYLIQLNGKRAEDNEALALKKESELIVQTRLWKVVTETLRYQAQRRMFEEAKTPEDMNWGKALLHAIGVFENVVATVQNPLLISDQKAVINTPGQNNLVKKSLPIDNNIK